VQEIDGLAHDDDDEAAGHAGDRRKRNQTRFSRRTRRVFAAVFPADGPLQQSSTLHRRSPLRFEAPTPADGDCNRNDIDIKYDIHAGIRRGYAGRTFR